MKYGTILIILSVLSVALAQQQKLTVTSFEDPKECCFKISKPGNFQKIGKNYYELHKDNLTWIDALSNCAEHDSQLASIDTLEELDAISKHLLDINYTEWVWVASMDKLSVGLFRWIASGKSIPKEFWSDGNPDHPESEHCVHLWPKGANGSYRLNNLGCDQKLHYLCQKKAPKAATVLMLP